MAAADSPVKFSLIQEFSRCNITSDLVFHVGTFRTDKLGMLCNAGMSRTQIQNNKGGIVKQ